MDFPTAHALLRNRRRWRGSLHGLTVDTDGGPGDGELLLSRVPAPPDGKPVRIPVTLPCTREVSGIAAGPCQALFIADTAHDRILYIDGRCGEQAWLPPSSAPAGVPGSFRSPRGLALAPDALAVADSGDARVQRLAFPQLEAHLAWDGWGEPVSLAVDSARRTLVIDAADGTLHRLHANGAADAGFDFAVAASARLARPLFVACDSGDRVLVADAGNDEVVVFDSAGAVLYALPGTPGWLPGALAVRDARIYVADAATGAIAVFAHDGLAAQRLGTVGGWHGPVTALTLGEDGALYIKPGLDAGFYRFPADGAFIASGTIAAGPFDAGEDREWERAFADIELPAGATLALEVAAADSDASPPAPADWVLLPAPDALLDRFTAPGRRFAWLRLSLASADGRASPRLRQVRLATAAEDYLDYLPLTYRHHDAAADGFLSRWLRLVRGGFGRVEELLDDMPRLADPHLVPAAALGWLAAWFGLELPRIATNEERRALLARAVQLMAMRGTRQSIAEFVELHTGIAPAIVEGFTDRRIWVLGQDSLLDFGTRLAPLDPMGMVVADPPRQAGCRPPALPAIGRAVVGESGPLAPHQIGRPLFAEDAWRFCVVVDAYRARDPGIVQEITRIVEREKPAHTDWRLALVAPELRVGFQSRIGVDAIVGGDPPPGDGARVGDTPLDGSLTLN
jgi:phage tail-like protein